MKEEKGIIHRGRGAYLRCPVSTAVPLQPSRRGFYRIHVCEGEITGDNIYRCQSVSPVVLNDFEFLKENITSQTL
jgi:hypothetical protein